MPNMPEYMPDLDRLHIRWALTGLQRFPDRAPHYVKLIRFALARLRQNGQRYV